MEFQNGFNPFPDFLRIFNSHEHSQFLLMPKSYNKYYPKPLPETAVLKKPEGTFWTVKWTVTEDGETISFQDGWKQFIKDNGVMDGEFLLFTYDGCRKFWVQIHRNGLPLKSNTPVKIQEISDDEAEKRNDNDDHHDMEEGDNNDNMVISLSLGTSDEFDDGEEYTSIYETAGSSKKAQRVGNKNYAASIAERHLDDPKNPFFISTSSSSRRVLVISSHVMKDYGLKVERTVNLIDGFGELKRKIGKWKDRVVVLKWDEMYKRNNIKEEDVIICEILLKGDNVVRNIKLHFVKKCELNKFL